jgi:hypothetical protein
MERVDLPWDRHQASDEKQKDPKVSSIEVTSIRESLVSSDSSISERTTQQTTKMFSKKLYFGVNSWGSDGWTWEILMLALSLAAFAVLVVILSIYQGKTTPQLPLDITFNAIISTLATISKSTTLLVVAASMSQYKWLWLRDTKQGCSLRDIQLVDAASRGPWGSFILLPYLRKRWFVALGAVAIIASTATEPLVQQVPSFTTKTLHTPSKLAKVSRVLSWMSQGELSQDSKCEHESDPT